MLLTTTSQSPSDRIFVNYNFIQQTFRKRWELHTWTLTDSSPSWTLHNPTMRTLYIASGDFDTWTLLQALLVVLIHLHYKRLSNRQSLHRASIFSYRDHQLPERPIYSFSALQIA